ncbi:Central kinetochore subunit CHL4 [Tolypocladium ophioglossoides CBS 100239]|uniref:Central kinetochore subunit CHL4 n=1 Tax=Tolypocladium ophioglossoides (strain CBS 100239) TaxID=1163406 RepID=A0A0L0NJ20_TOLOC|nr:Central kinetochore subunit CHL4 [Tolypocladium ophioglossoides CBS 100239]
MARLSIPTKARLPSSLCVETSNPAIVKSLSRLSRESLISLALDWLDENALANAAPHLRQRRHDDEDEEEDDPDDLYPPYQSINELRKLYTDMQQQKGSKRDVVGRILEGDWRHGLTLYQLAMVDFSYLDEHPTSQRWTAYSILPLKPPSKDAEDGVIKVDDKSLAIPRFHPSTFLQNLQLQVLPDVKAHYHFYRPKDFAVLLLRIFIIDSPYNTNLALSSVDSSGTATNFSSSRTVYLAFPDGSPSLYITRSQATGPISLGESKSLHGLIVNGVPKALSRPHERYTLKSTNLTSRNLDALLDKKGPGRGNAAGGGWSIYANEKTKKSPLDTVLPTPPLAREPSRSDIARKRRRSMTKYDREAKRAKLAAKARFGDSGLVTDGKGLERVEILMQDPFPASNVLQDPGSDEDERQASAERLVDRRRSKVNAVLRQARADVEDVNDEEDASRWTPTVRLAFQGSHVFAGIRQLVEAGIVDGKRMPGWMTGEEGVSTGVVRHGRIRGRGGSGL